MTFTWLRARMKTILGATIILIIPAFVFWGAGTGTLDTNTVAMRINGHDVPIPEYQEAAETYAVQQLRDRYIVRDAASEIGLRVSDKAITAALRDQPFFQGEDGSFDADKWNRVVSSDRGKRALEERIPAVRDALLLEGLRDMVTGAVIVTDQEIRDQFAYDYARRRIAYVEFIPADLVGQVSYTEDDLKAYFEANGVQYTVPEQVRLRVVQLSKTPSAADSAEVEVLIHELERRAQEGEDFAALAAEYSQGPNAADGGDLGWIRRTELIDELAIVFDLAPGEITPPIHTSFGWNLLKLEASRGVGADQEAHVYRIMLQEAPSEETFETLYATMDALQKEARESGLQAAATKLGLDVIEVEPIALTATSVPGIQDGRDVLAGIEDLGAGEITDTLDGRQALTVAEVAERIEAHVPPMDDVRDRLINDYTLLQAGKLAEARAGELAKAAREAGGLAAASAVEPTTTDLFPRNGTIPGLGRPGTLFDEAFRMQPGAIGEPVSHGPRWLVFEVTEAADADPSLFDIQGPTLRTTLETDRRRQAWADYLEKLRTDAVFIPNLAIINIDSGESTTTS